MRHLDKEEQKRYKELRGKKAVKLSSMKYTKEIPTKPGHYWMRNINKPGKPWVSYFDQRDIAFNYCIDGFEYSGVLVQPDKSKFSKEFPIATGWYWFEHVDWVSVIYIRAGETPFTTPMKYAGPIEEPEE